VLQTLQKIENALCYKQQIAEGATNLKSVHNKSSKA
jgi:hypothetical protein